MKTFLVCLFAAAALGAEFVYDVASWENKQCSGTPLFIMRYQANVTGTTTCSNYLKTNCSASSTAETSSQAACPDNIESAYSLVSSSDTSKYLKTDIFDMDSDCQGAIKGKQLYLADGKCKKMSTNNYLLINCDDKKAQAKNCFDSACTNCTAINSFEGDLGTCWKRVIRFARCAAANDASMVGLSIILTLVSIAMSVLF